jgi:tellurite resistance protein TerC
MEWVLFNILVLGLLALDLFVFHRKGQKETIRKSFLLSLFWIGLSLLFNVFVYFWEGPTPALEFLTGYVIEKSLSVDNLFVMALILSYFRIPQKDQHAVLFWGIIGALVMRLICILGGVALINQFHWIVYILGAFLLYTGIKFFFQSEEPGDPEKSFGVKLVKKIFPKATPFMLALISIEYTDLIFALDSIPAILAITNDAFIIYTSNVFAILGLRALYSVLAHSMQNFVYLKQGIACILIFVGLKMISAPFFKIPIPYALAVIVLILSAAILLSLRVKRR